MCVVDVMRGVEPGIEGLAMEGLLRPSLGQVMISQSKEGKSALAQSVGVDGWQRLMVEHGEGLGASDGVVQKKPQVSRLEEGRSGEHYRFPNPAVPLVFGLISILAARSNRRRWSDHMRRRRSKCKKQSTQCALIGLGHVIQ